MLIEILRNWDKETQCAINREDRDYWEECNIDVDSQERSCYNNGRKG